jgi:hypothetical protein
MYSVYSYVVQDCIDSKDKRATDRRLTDGQTTDKMSDRLIVS